MVNDHRRENGIQVFSEVSSSGEVCPMKQPDITAPGSDGQQIAIASYINPLGDPAAWARLLEYDTGKVSVLVANVLNGPDYIVDPAWKSVIDKAASSGKKILGYVRTGYLGVSQQKFTTRLGSNDLIDWICQIEQDVDKWYELYGSSIGGIFFDEGWPECGIEGDKNTANRYVTMYRHVNNYTKRKYPGAFTVLNPGSPIASCYEDSMDALMTFENSYQAYQDRYVPNDWTPKDPRKIWHIIYRVPQDKIKEVAALAKSRHAGLIEITDDDNPNPYDNLPNDAYMKTLMATVPGGKPHVAEPPQFYGNYISYPVEDLRVIASDYSSVTLNWRSVSLNNGHGVWLDGKMVLELPPMIDRATIGMLDPGSSNLQFEIRPRMLGVEASTPTFITASTKSLPSSGTISKLTRKKNGDELIMTADVLVPYAFVRLFLSSKGSAFLEDGKGWPLVFQSQSGTKGGIGVYDYLVEGNDFYSALYSYTGSWDRSSTANAEWSWNPQPQAVRQTQSGYTYTWVIRWAEADGKNDFAVQGQGYAPLTNVIIVV
jgi:spherulation-specific family 4 protein